MASVLPYGKKWRAFIKKKDPSGKQIKRSKVFNSKTEANDWAVRAELEIASGKKSTPNKTLHQLLERYRDNESVKKRSYKYETKRLDHIISFTPDIALDDLSNAFMAEWRDSRLQSVSNATVAREMTILTTAFNVAKREWGWLADNPLEGVKRPKQPPARDRLISSDEVDLIKHTTGFVDCPDTVSSRVGAAFLFAIETAMRSGEIVNVKPDSVTLEKRTLFIPMSKNGSSRNVPLSSKAIEILELVNCDFDLTPRQIDSLFRKAKKKAGIEDLHFHDTRHQAITNLSKKMDVLDLARSVGIKDLKMLMVYYNETAENIAKLLD